MTDPQPALPPQRMDHGRLVDREEVTSPGRPASIPPVRPANSMQGLSLEKVRENMQRIERRIADVKADRFPAEEGRYVFIRSLHRDEDFYFPGDKDTPCPEVFDQQWLMPAWEQMHKAMNDSGFCVVIRHLQKNTFGVYIDIKHSTSPPPPSA